MVLALVALHTLAQNKHDMPGCVFPSETKSISRFVLKQEAYLQSVIKFRRYVVLKVDVNLKNLVCVLDAAANSPKKRCKNVLFSNACQ